ncbi:hypothetical protein NW063_04845 [Mycoplasmopsis cynos]|uniref:hypothetical protein n=1 Tax=Mycoplasmopsis cynos TaxID=171284 RepID=UPI0022025F41|nr:hypothetical protein [Mycoplasmopsis cynos]UWV86115.1 hypothetical protein NW063_04845 [Mycoplasmopsis cynos]
MNSFNSFTFSSTVIFGGVCGVPGAGFLPSFSLPFSGSVFPLFSLPVESSFFPWFGLSVSPGFLFGLSLPSFFGLSSGDGFDSILSFIVFKSLYEFAVSISFLILLFWCYL